MSENRIPITPEQRVEMLLREARVVGPVSEQITVRMPKLFEHITYRVKFEAACSALLMVVESQNDYPPNVDPAEHAANVTKRFGEALRAVQSVLNSSLMSSAERGQRREAERQATRDLKKLNPGGH